MLSIIAYGLMRLFGWNVTGKYPFEVPKVIIAVAPHTSNWDFPIGLGTKLGWKIPAGYAAKHTLFWGPMAYFHRYFDGVPVDRSKKGGNFVANLVDKINELDHFHLVIAPEGRRDKVERFKTGFYHIAKQAGIPICLCSFNWDKKEVHFDPELFYPTDNEEADLQYIWNYYKGKVGYRPEHGIS
jgi:1-acyl-sn-glycerol-3-phosphate acyltransferase